VDLSDDLPPPRRSLFFPVVIATVFLTIIGMSAGIALASWHQDQNLNNQGQSSGTPPATAPASPESTAEPCPPQTQTIAEQKGNAQGTLRTVLVLVTKSSTIWICKDDAGQLFYQANRGDADSEWIEGQTALFLTGVQSDGAGGYRVTDAKGTTSFSINSTRLRIVHKDGSVETQPAA
jgi:hypothetical protein